MRTMTVSITHLKKGKKQTSSKPGIGDPTHATHASCWSELTFWAALQKHLMDNECYRVSLFYSMLDHWLHLLGFIINSIREQPQEELLGGCQLRLCIGGSGGEPGSGSSQTEHSWPSPAQDKAFILISIQLHLI